MEAKTFLFLVNNAPFVRQFAAKTGEHLRAQGCTVLYALDSHSSDYMDPVALPGSAHYFTDYLRADAAANPVLPPEAFNGLTWGSLFPDIDRYIGFETDLPGGTDLYRRAMARLQPFFLKILSDHRVDFVIYEDVTNSFAQAAFDACLMTGARYIGLASSRLPGRMEFWESRRPWANDFEIAYHKMLAEGIPDEIIPEISHYLEHFEHSVPSYMTTNKADELSITSKYMRVDKWVRLFRQAKYALMSPDDITYAYQTTSPLRWSLAFLKRAIYRRGRQVLKWNQFDPVDMNEKYYLYPLHFHPEASTSVMAKYYVDEIAAVKNIAFSLPLDAVLYVKEHPSGQYLNSLEMYNTLKRMPNVKLIHPRANTKELIRRSEGIFTLCSTVGQEACILGKPVVLLGTAAYEWFPSCKRIDSYSELPKAIEWLSSFSAPSEKMVRTFIAVFFCFSRAVAFDFQVLSRSDENFNEFFKQFCMHLGLMN